MKIESSSLPTYLWLEQLEAEVAELTATVEILLRFNPEAHALTPQEER